MNRSLLIFTAALFSTGAVGQTTEWSVPLEGPAHSPTLYPDATSATAVAVCAGNTLSLIDGKGAVLWAAKEDSPLATPATAADLDGDGAAELVVARGDGMVACYGGTGDVRWRTDSLATSAGGYKNLVAADVVASPGLEVLTGFDDGWLHCLSADGKPLWRFYGDKFRVGGIAVADVDEDGAPEVFYGTDNGHIYCLDGHGRLRWRYFELAPYGRSGPNVADLDGDGRAELLITRSNVGSATCLMALDAQTGRFLWRTADYMQSYVSNAIADIHGDGRFEVFHSDKGNMLYCDNADGSRRWQIELAGGGLFWAPAVADVDGDGHMEILAGCRYTAPETRNCFYVVSDEGKLKQALALGGGSNASPAVADIDGDGKLEAVVVTNNPDQVLALTWDAAGRVAWPSLRGDSRMLGTGAGDRWSVAGDRWPVDGGGARLDAGEAYWGENVWRVSWDAPALVESCLEVRVEQAGCYETRVVELKPGAVSAEVEVWLQSEGEVAVTVAMHESAPSDGGPLFVVTREVKALPPDSCDYEAVAGAVAEAVEPLDAASANAGALRRELSLLAADAETVRQMRGNSLAEVATALRERAGRLRERARLLGGWWRAGHAGHFICWQDQNPWDAFDPYALPSELDEQAGVHVTAYGNEFENVALTLLNVTGETIDVRCVWNAPELGQSRPQPDPELAGRVTLRRLIPVASAFSERVFDPLPELDLSRSISLSPGEARQVWLEIDTRGLAPGAHDLTLYLASLTKPITVLPVKLSVEVWPVELPEGVFKKINWSTFDPAVASEQSVRDMIDHGVNVIYGPALPQTAVDAQGNLAGPMDWAKFDELLARAPGHFTLLWSAPPARKWPEGVNPDAGSEAYFTGFKTALCEMAAHLRERGFAYGQWAFYPIDEPWNTGATHVAQLKEFAQMVKRADPEAMVYTDPAGGVRAEYLDEFKDLIDIWQPEINHLKRDPALLGWFRKNARHFWAYEATGPAKDLLPLGYYRAYGWLAWKLGVEGAGYWVYKGVDVWWPIDGCDYSAVYQTGSSVVPSRRWQADRDGAEDYRALYLLRQAIQGARDAGRTADADRAQALMDEAVQNVAGWQVDTIDEITRQTRDYEVDFELLLRYREEIAREILRLRGDRHAGFSRLEKKLSRG